MASDPVAVAKPKHSLLPVLVVLFLASYGLMAMLVVEQGRTIENQRGLIRSLFSDSSQLVHLKSKMAKQQAGAEAQAPAKGRSQAQTPSIQATPRDNAKNKHKAEKLPKLPSTPADTAITDARRTVWTI